MWVWTDVAVSVEMRDGEQRARAVCRLDTQASGVGGLGRLLLSTPGARRSWGKWMGGEWCAR